MITLRFLTTSKDHQHLCEDYWALTTDKRFVHSISALASTHRLSHREIGRIVRACCEASLDSPRCASCGAHYKMAVRSDFYERPRKTKDWICESCRSSASPVHTHIEDLSLAGLEHTDVRASGFVTPPTFPAFQMGLKEAAFMYCLLRAGATPDRARVDPVASFKIRLSPHPAYDGSILTNLFDSGLLGIPAVDPNAIYLELITDVPYLLSMEWRAIDTERSSIRIWQANLINALKSTWDWPPHWKAQRLVVGDELDFQEYREFYQHARQQLGLEVEGYDDSELILAPVLGAISPEMVFGLIWQAVSEAKSLNERHALNRGISDWLQMRVSELYTQLRLEQVRITRQSWPRAHRRSMTSVMADYLVRHKDEARLEHAIARL